MDTTTAADQQPVPVPVSSSDATQLQATVPSVTSAVQDSTADSKAEDGATMPSPAAVEGSAAGQVPVNTGDAVVDADAGKTDPEPYGMQAETQDVVESVEQAEPLASNTRDETHGQQLEDSAGATDDGNDRSEKLATILQQMARMRDDLQALMSGMAPGDAERHTTQLHALQDALSSCAATLPASAPTESEITASSEEAVVEEEENSPPPPVLPNYLEQLPEGPLEGILRFFSSRPRAADWGKHIAARDAEALLLLEGALGDAARRRFTDVELNSGMGSSSSRLGEVLLSMREAPDRVNAVLNRTGVALTKLAYVGDRDENSPPHLTAWMQPFAAHCCNVSHLTLHRVHTSYFGTILAACGAQLESLTLDVNTSTRAHLYLVGQHCSGLRKLTMCPGLSIPELLWEKLGGTLTELEMTPATKPPGPKIILKYIQEHCKHITRFTLSKESAPPELIELLKSYGEQLEYAKANFGFLPFPTVTSLATACPNAVFELSGPLKPDIVMGLQYRVHTLKFSKPLLDPVPPTFFEDCKHVRVLSVQMPDSDSAWLVSALLRDPKPHLAEVSITGTQDNPTEILDTLAQKTTKLTKLKLCSKALPVDTLEPVVKANPGLLKITLKARSPELRTVRQVLAVCAQCKELRELRIGKVSSPSPPPRPPLPDTVASATAFEIARTADACMPLRRRNTYVQICSVDYVF